MSGESSASRRGLETDRRAASGFVHARLVGQAAAPPVGVSVAAVCFLGFVAIWTLYGSIADAGMSLHGDVVEAYSWGREFRLGYNQHPPFWAWIAGLWFLLFPNQSWAFHLLAVVNSAIGLLGSWRLIGLFARGWERLAAWMLLLLTPFYTFMCYKYNANSIFLSIWPWTLHFLLTSIETRRPSRAIWLGIMLAAGLLSKYYAITLDLTCLAASVIHPGARAYYRSVCPYLSAGVCAVLVTPHVAWLLGSDAPPVVYVWGHTGIGMNAALVFALRFVVSVVLFHALVLLVVLSAAGWVRLDPRALLRNRVLTVLVVAPVILTALFGLLFELKISSNMTIGVFPLLPLLAMRMVPGLQPERLFRRTAWVAGCITVAVVLASPAVAYVTFAASQEPEATEPRQELASLVTLLWHERTDRRLAYVAGTDPYENSIGFYSTDRPAVFLSFDRHKAPWVQPQALKRDGMVAACTASDTECERKVQSFLTPDSSRYTIRLRHVFDGHSRAPISFRIYLVLPPPGTPPPPRSGGEVEGEEVSR